MATRPWAGCQAPALATQVLRKEHSFAAPPAGQPGPTALPIVYFCNLERSFNPKAAGEAACEHVQALALLGTSSGSRRYWDTEPAAPGCNRRNHTLLASAAGSSLPVCPPQTISFLFFFAFLSSLHMLKKGKEELSPPRSQWKRTQHPNRYVFTVLSGLTSWGWQLPKRSTEQFYQVLGNSWSILTNSQGHSLTALYQSNVVAWKAHSNI